MGTRGLLGFIIRNQRRGTYNHWDSYPENLGARIVHFILSLNDEQRHLMLDRLDKIEWLERDRELPHELVQHYKELEFHMTEYDKQRARDEPQRAERFSTMRHDWISLFQGIQGAPLLPLILDGSLKHLVDATDFTDDGLFCEYAYWIDFDKGTLSMDVGGGEGVWTFEQLKNEDGFWYQLVIKRKEADRQLQIRDAEWERRVTQRKEDEKKRTALESGASLQDEPEFKRLKLDEKVDEKAHLKVHLNDDGGNRDHKDDSVKLPSEPLPPTQDTQSSTTSARESPSPKADPYTLADAPNPTPPFPYAEFLSSMFGGTKVLPVSSETMDALIAGTATQANAHIVDEGQETDSGDESEGQQTEQAVDE